ncbi:hypothetical protein JQ616_37935 [Bradyrhizobium tropiciagri]|uniref:hypothetical protein n=1 Tax=Bradyrhizobium TaxID=374 RepID=UPI001A24FE6F|nr:MULTISPECIES: hypothetical protein [Bradyrhizobium]MBJ7405933.1 hypothetical protein [Bradyrhizobium sp.]MBR0900768.1 hypothetical protein [Bradyrhizobium tropiciagri]
MAAVVQQIIQLLSSIGIASYGLGYLIDVLSHLPWGSVVDWFRAAPAIQMAPHLSLGNEALYAQYQQVMDTQFQIGELKRIILTMPALPSEGF